MERFNELIKTIKQYMPSAICECVNLKNFDKPLLVVAIKGSKHKIMIYDSPDIAKEIAEISYSNNKKDMFLSTFEVNEQYQQKGLGRFLFNLAVAHVDSTGTSRLYGQANPTNNIKGVSNVEGKTFNHEKQAIIEVYKKLGCHVGFDGNFEQTWKPGEKIKNANELIIYLAQKISSQSEFESPKQMQ